MDLDGVCIDFCAQMLTGEMSVIPNVHFVMVDARDVVKHHFNLIR